MEFILTALTTIAMAVIFCLLEKHTGFGKLSKWRRQLIIGVFFGISACLASDFGTPFSGAIINVRDAAPLTAALVFGAPAGLIAGVLGGVYRLFWGAPFAQMFSSQWINTMFLITSAGGFTRAACTVGTICAGLFGAMARKCLFSDKRPSVVEGFVAGAIVEIFHMIMVFVFRLNYMTKGYAVLQVASAPMIIGNALTVALSIFFVALICGDSVRLFKKSRSLNRSFRNGLLICVAFAFCITTFGMFAMQRRLGLRQTEETLAKNLSDLEEKIKYDGSVDTFIYRNFTWHVGQDGGIIICEVIKGEDGRPKELVVVLNGEEYSKGQVIEPSSMTGTKIRGLADNFFVSDLALNGEITPIYGMYTNWGKYMIISYVPIAEADIYQNISVILTAFFQVLIYTAIFITVFYLIQKLVLNNIHKINEKLSEITQGNLDTVVDVRTHNEFEALSEDINETVTRLKQYIHEAEERIDKELEFAKAIQHSALPSVFPPYPNRKDLDIYATMHTAKEVGGDFYDFYFTDKNRLAFLIADVSGKGIPASLFMMTSKTFLKSYAENGLPVNEVLTVTNEKLCENNDAGMFVTAFMCEADMKTGLINFANAGHNPPIVGHTDGTFEYLKPRAGFVLAGMEGVRYRKQELQLQPGECLYLYTDGVTEATNSENELYGEQRLLSVLNSGPYEDMQSLCAAVKGDVDAFVGEAPQFDDITMLAFRYLGEPPVPTLTYEKAALEHIPEITEFIEAQLENMGCSMKTVFQINVAVDEICSNIIHYAYPEGGGLLTVKIFEKPNPRRVFIRFEDEGIPYNPLVKEAPDVTLSAEERDIGGLGIYIVKKTMDDVRYKYENEKNILTIIKNLDV